MTTDAVLQPSSSHINGPAPGHANMPPFGFVATSVACRIAGGCCPKTLHRGIRRGQVRGTYLAGRWLWDVDSIRSWAEARGVERRGRPRRIPITVSSGEEVTDGG